MPLLNRDTLARQNGHDFQPVPGVTFIKYCSRCVQPDVDRIIRLPCDPLPPEVASHLMKKRLALWAEMKSRLTKS